jgi:AAHS family 4-hydroxybenzoate transporter-like MFS transporter
VNRLTALDIRRFIDERPVSRYQMRVAVMCGLIVFVDGFDAQAMGYVAPALTVALKISRGVLGSVISSGLVGMMIGALVSGPLADRIGRKPVLIACSLIFGLGSLLTATHSPWNRSCSGARSPDSAWAAPCRTPSRSPPNTCPDAVAPAP